MPKVEKVRATERMSEGGCQWGRLGEKKWDGRPASISKRADPRDQKKPCGHLTNCPLHLSAHTRTPVQRSHSGALPLPSLIQILWKEAELDFRNPAISSARSVCSSRGPVSKPVLHCFVLHGLQACNAIHHGKRTAHEPNRKNYIVNASSTPEMLAACF
jgi:hypothetical protein